MEVDLQELLVKYQQRLDACQEQGRGISDIGQRVAYNVQCTEHYEQLMIMTRLLVAMEKLANGYRYDR